MNTQHWKADASYGFIEDGKGNRVCQFWDKGGESFHNKSENMDRIVRAVNSHEHLLAALHDCREALRRCSAIGELAVVDAAIADAAIAKATGGRA
jgi:hypothetical protein